MSRQPNNVLPNMNLWNIYLWLYAFRSLWFFIAFIILGVAISRTNNTTGRL